MAKLKVNTVIAGINTGKEKFVTLVDPNEIEQHPEISAIFSIDHEIVEKITASMVENGYDNSQPVVLWKQNEKNYMVEGHTRLQASKQAHLLEIPATFKDFEDLTEAKLYCFKRQAERRNLTNAQIFQVPQMM